MARWEVTWERGPQAIEIPDRNIAGLIERPEIPPIADPVAATLAAIDAPIGCPPLAELARPGQRAALLVTDWHDAIFGVDGGVGLALLDRLNASGIPDERITVVHAAGMHGHQRGRQKVGEAITGRVRYVEHNPLDESELVYLGCTWQGTPLWVNRVVAEADLIVGFGGCGPSLYGFQGGGGIILPGVAGRDTVRHNHSKIMTTRLMPGWGPGNPMREDVLDAADLARLQLKIDVTAAGEILAGAPRAEWPVAVAQVRERFMVGLPEPPDIYVLALDGRRAGRLAGGIYMSLEFAAQTVRPGGIVIVVCSAAADEPIEGRPLATILAETIERTEQWCNEYDDEAKLRFWRERDIHCKEELMCYSLEELTRVVIRRQGEPRSTCMSWSHRRALEEVRAFLVSEGVSPATGAAMGFACTTTSFAAALDQALGELGPDARIAVNPPPRNGVPRVP
jgi:nickel-dependent lactate racemase